MLFIFHLKKYVEGKRHLFHYLEDFMIQFDPKIIKHDFQIKKDYNRKDSQLSLYNYVYNLIKHIFNSTLSMK